MNIKPPHSHTNLYHDIHISLPGVSLLLQPKCHVCKCSLTWRRKSLLYFGYSHYGTESYSWRNEFIYTPHISISGRRLVDRQPPIIPLHPIHTYLGKTIVFLNLCYFLCYLCQGIL